MFKQLIIFVLLFLFNLNIQAAPAPLGIELNKTTLSEIKKSYNIIDTAPNATVGYYNNFLNIVDFGVKDLSKMIVINDSNDIIVGVIMFLPENNFDDTFQKFTQTYELVNYKKGNDFVEFRDGNDYLISLSMPHKRPLLEIGYYSINFLDNINLRLNQQKSEKK